MDASPKLHFQCPYCSKRVSATHDYAGKRGKCPHCENVVDIPLQQPTKATAAPRSAGFEQLVDELVEIGAAVEDRSYSASGFLARAFDDGSTRSARAREIGASLHELGGMDMMLRAHGLVKDRLRSL